MKLLSFLIYILILVTHTGCSLFGIQNEEQPSYKVLNKEGRKEIREYQPYLVAKTTVVGSFKEAQSKGFKILAGYIFGKNISKEKIPMTAPVVQSNSKSSEKISMTAPVIIEPTKDNKNSWTMTFSMPSKYSLQTLPKPDDDRVQFETVPLKLLAVHQFSGFWNESINKEKAQELSTWLREKNKYQEISEAKFAGYNPPWTLPFLRTNEMHIEVEPINK